MHFPANAVKLDVEREICSKVLHVSKDEPPLNWDDEMELSEEAQATSRERLVAKWKHYRTVIWPLDSRAQVLFQEESSEELTNHILGNRL